MTANGQQPREVDLPEGWALTRMDTAGAWSTGGTPSRKVPAYFGGDIPWVKSGDLNDGILSSTEEHLTPVGLKESPAKLVAAGSVSIALYGATIGKLGMLAMPAATNQACANCEVDERAFRRKYIFYYLMSQRHDLIDAGQGGAQPNLSNQIVRNWPLPIPPLAEQERIVAKLETVLARVNNARERLARVPAILKRFRQSVLAAACSGRLTADWREQHPDVEPADQLMSRIAEERDRAQERNPRRSARASEPNWPTQKDPEIPESWLLASLNDLLHYDRSASYGVLQPGPDVSNGIPMVRVCDIDGGRVLVHQLKRIAPEIDAQYQRTRLQGGEVLVTLVGTIGRAAVAPREAAGSNIARAVGMFPLCPHVFPHFVELMLTEPAKNTELVELAREVARKTLNLGLIKEVRIPVAPRSEQQEIVCRVDNLFRLAEIIEGRVAQATRRADKLTQSTLARAFRGELVPTEAELARAEGRSYESAAELLERIRRARKNR